MLLVAAAYPCTTAVYRAPSPRSFPGTEAHEHDARAHEPTKLCLHDAYGYKNRRAWAARHTLNGRSKLGFNLASM